MSDDYVELKLHDRPELSPDTGTGTSTESVARRAGLAVASRSGASWFYWIAGLSLVNSIARLMGGEWRFGVGLGLTELIDAIGLVIAAKSPAVGTAVRVVVFVADLALAGIFVIFGVLARQRKNAAFVIGMSLYALDALLVMWFGDLFSVLIHGLGLFGLYKGLQASQALAAEEAAA